MKPRHSEKWRLVHPTNLYLSQGLQKFTFSGSDTAPKLNDFCCQLAGKCLKFHKQTYPTISKIQPPGSFFSDPFFVGWFISSWSFQVEKSSPLGWSLGSLVGRSFCKETFVTKLSSCTTIPLHKKTFPRGGFWCQHQHYPTPFLLGEARNPITTLHRGIKFCSNQISLPQVGGTCTSWPNFSNLSLAKSPKRTCPRCGGLKVPETWDTTEEAAGERNHGGRGMIIVNSINMIIIFLWIIIIWGVSENSGTPISPPQNDDF